ncbi:eEF1A lysine and N-terminal methyltransferase isoform X1 [Acipenser ruthenus]|uniref:eEF1A lysine and N-terminal methyltransferase isoform X1 n=1 Tax=Acipenser ruthenus TaxID=7906 RepID=UPI0027419CA2|nr:eEF1A lysine and N-terminal methyltransferase isoform X1 [Acipenser ruthenus]
MNLLPKSSKEFSSAEYWEKFFKKRGDKSFEWYGTYTELCGVLHRYIKPTDAVLVVGCGSSELSEQMYDAGYRALTNIDISTTALARMQERNSARRPDMAFLCVDAQHMEPFSDGSFQAVLDKGTLDALAPDGSPDTLGRVGRVFAEVCRVLRVGGRYVCVTLAQEHVLRAAVDHFSAEGWAVRVHRVEGQEGGFCLPVFVLVCTKFRRPAEGGAALPQILEVCEGEEGPPRRLGAPEELLDAVREIQAYALLRSQLASHTDPAQTPTLQLCHAHTGRPRYSCHVVDSPAGATLHRASHFAVFIVPQGRETNWLFGTAEGRSQLAGSAGFRRLVVVAMHRDQEYQDMEAIQSELSAKVMELAPPGLPANHQVPFLSVGGDLGQRSVMHRGSSTLSGDFVVEDVRGEEGRLYRRLVFLSNSSVVQSESLLGETGNPAGSGRKRNRKKKGQRAGPVQAPPPEGRGQAVDRSFLCCAHHRVMVSGLALLRGRGTDLAEGPVSVLLVGLGGGALPQFLHDYVRGSRVQVLEIDPAVLQVASGWFGFEQDDRLTVTLGDGLELIDALAQGGNCSYDVIMFDVDSKDPTLGMSCPPPAFVEQSFLEKVKSILTPQGVFVLNLVCRDPALRVGVLSVLRGLFPQIYECGIEDEVNEILLCQQGPQEQALTPPELLSAGQALQGALRRPGQPWDCSLDIAALLENLRIA